jgi:hypothetical protein
MGKRIKVAFELTLDLVEKLAPLIEIFDGGNNPGAILAQIVLIDDTQAAVRASFYPAETMVKFQKINGIPAGTTWDGKLQYALRV